MSTLDSEEPEKRTFHPGLARGHKGLFAKIGGQNGVFQTAVFLCVFLIFRHLLSGSPFVLLQCAILQGQGESGQNLKLPRDCQGKAGE